MKIAFINQPWSLVLPPVRSGSLSIWTWEVARRLARDHSVTVYEGCKQRPVPKVEPCEGVRYRVLWVGPDEFYLRVYNRLAGETPASRQPPATALYYFTYAVRVALEIRREGYDVVHIHQCSQFASIIRAFNPKTRIVLHMHCEWLTQFDPKLIEPRLTAPSLIVGCSPYITDLINSRFPEIASRCGTVPNGVDLETFSDPPPDWKPASSKIKRLMFVGRVSPEKGLHTLLEAFSLVVRQSPDVQLDIVGPEWTLPANFIVDLSTDPLVAGLKQFYTGRYNDHLRERISAEAKDKVRFTGPIPQDRLARWYHEADILINPSLSESFGMTVTEAMACGKPVIVTRVGGMTDLVQHGKSGLIVPPNDPAALSDAVLYLLGNEELRRSMGEAGRRRVRELYSWDTVAAEWLQCVAEERGHAAATARSMHMAAGQPKN